MISSDRVLRHTPPVNTVQWMITPQAVYAVLLESTMRSTAPLPYWKLPGAVQLVPRLRAAQAHVDLLNATLDRLIAAAREQLQRDEVQGAGRQQQQQEVRACVRWCCAMDEATRGCSLDWSQCAREVVN